MKTITLTYFSREECLLIDELGFIYRMTANELGLFIPGTSRLKCIPSFGDKFLISRNIQSDERI